MVEDNIKENDEVGNCLHENLRQFESERKIIQEIESVHLTQTEWARIFALRGITYEGGMAMNFGEFRDFNFVEIIDDVFRLIDEMKRDHYAVAQIESAKVGMGENLLRMKKEEDVLMI